MTASAAPPSSSIPNAAPHRQDSVPATGEVVKLKLTKLGVLNRKDDILEGGRKASNRKWKPCSVLLTGSQLLFFKDTNLAAAIMEQSNNHESHAQSVLFRPDELLSVKDAIAVSDKSYVKVQFTHPLQHWN